MATKTSSKSTTSGIDFGKFASYGAGLIVALLFVLWLADAAQGLSGARMIQTTITGILEGGVIALVALGIVLINKASGVFNFAHGYMMLLGGFIFYAFFTTSAISPVAAALLATLSVLMVATAGKWRDLLNPVILLGSVAVIVALVVMMTLPGEDWQKWVRALAGGVTGSVLIGVTVERFAIRPLIGQPLFAAVMMTLAVSQVLRGIIQATWGSLEARLPIFATIDPITGLPQSLSPQRMDARESLGGIIIVKTELLFAFGLAIAAFAVFFLFFRFTNIGLAMRAMAENQELAQSVGMRVRIILAIAWAIAALLAATAGILQGGASNLSLNLPLLALAAFPAVILGGLDSIGGALLGGLIIGLVSEWATLLFPGTQAGTELAPYVVLMIVLVIRPDGLFGQKRIERI